MKIWWESWQRYVLSGTFYSGKADSVWLPFQQFLVWFDLHICWSNISLINLVEAERLALINIFIITFIQWPVRFTPLQNVTSLVVKCSQACSLQLLLGNSLLMSINIQLVLEKVWLPAVTINLTLSMFIYNHRLWEICFKAGNPLTH